MTTAMPPPDPSTPTQAVRLATPDAGEELQRAELYGLLARLWFTPPDAPLLAQFAVAVTQAPEAGAFLEAPWQQLVGALRATTVDAAQHEHTLLFIGTGKAEVLPYASYQLTGTLNERPLVDLRTDLAALGLASAAPAGETEDHVALVFEVMRYLIAGDDLALCNLEQQRRFFRRHVQTWVGALCDEVERHPRAQVYAALASFTRAFVEVETQGFDLLD
jgi:TorA maturation chaperone TorD